jgi:hypothetical protein
VVAKSSEGLENGSGESGGVGQSGIKWESKKSVGNAKSVIDPVNHNPTKCASDPVSETRDSTRSQLTPFNDLRSPIIELMTIRRHLKNRLSNNELNQLDKSIKFLWAFYKHVKRTLNISDNSE